MKISGWIFLIVSWGTIIVMAVFCFYQLWLKKGQQAQEDANQ
jgi:hypothetical protein